MLYSIDLDCGIVESSTVYGMQAPTTFQLLFLELQNDH